VGIRKRGTRWLVTVECGLGTDGVRRRRCVTCATEDEAKRTLAKLSNDVYSGSYVDPTDMRVAAFLERWLEYTESRVVPATHRRYEGMVATHIVPRIGGVALAKLSPLHLTRLEADQLAAGLSPTTVRKHHWLLKAALDQAVAWRLIAVNPMTGITAVAESRPEIRTLDAAGQARLLDTAAGTRMHVPIALALGTGLRRGELLALRWSDLDLNANRLAVRRAMRFGAQRQCEFGPCKTAKSRRVVSLPPSLSALLTAHRTEQASHRALAGAGWHDGDLVFCAAQGAPWLIDSFATSWKRLRARAAASAGADARKEALELGATEEQAEQSAEAAAAPLAACRFHDLRHTHATELMRAGIHVKVVSERLGHSSVRVTLDRYSHVLPDMQDEAAAAANVLLAPLLRR
jgi:integrase